MLKNKKGFSLVELIVVIAIMAVLVGILAPTLITYVEKSRKQKDVSAAEELRNAVELALSDETVYEALPTETFTLTFASDSNNEVAVSAANITMATNVDACKTAIANSVSEKINKIKISSKAYKGKNILITLNYNTTNSTFTVATAEFVAKAA